MAKIKQAQERKDLGTLNLLMLSNIRNGAMLSILTKQAQRQAQSDYKKLCDKYEKMMDINNINYPSISVAFSPVNVSHLCRITSAYFGSSSIM